MHSMSWRCALQIVSRNCCVCYPSPWQMFGIPRRRFISRSSAMASYKSADWNATKYMQFGDERTRPARELLAQISLTSPKRVIDLGCGPGNSTELLAAKYPDSRLTGLDSSPNMLEMARKVLPDVEFALTDLSTYTPNEEVDVFFSNAVFQWIPGEQRIPIIARLLESQPSGSIFAFQVPDNFMEPSHAAMRETAAEGPWAATLAAANPARESVPSPQVLYEALKPLCSHVNIWHTYYYHILENHRAIIDWVSSTGLRPFVESLPEDQKKGFLEDYLKRIEKSYMPLVDGRVMLTYPRLFAVLHRA
ncbi:S-adenosyl-L-methionine-dependent methyltransferase [Lipomyces starkeyi]